MGVVGAVTPVTNPIVTPMCNGMFALKAGNAVIFAPHPKAQKCTEHLTREFMKVVKAHGGPDNLIQVVVNGSIEKTQQLMKAVDVVVATGGPAMVKSAYSSGKPSFGVGAGNVPVIIDRGVNIKDAVDKIVAGASYDNGIICSHEQFVLAPEENYKETLKLFGDTGKVWFTDDPAQVQKLRDIVFPGGALNKDVVGKPPRDIAALAGIEVPATVRLILLPAKGAGRDDVLAKEKLCPVIAILPYKTFPDAVAKAKANLLVEGAGHTAAVHSNDEEHIKSAGVDLPISRLVVNQASSLTAGGSLTNGFAPTTTLGCGSWGGNSISENLDYKHLMNVSRIGKVITGKKVPTDEEIWSSRHDDRARADGDPSRRSPRRGGAHARRGVACGRDPDCLHEGDDGRGDDVRRRARRVVERVGMEENVSAARRPWSPARRADVHGLGRALASCQSRHRSRHAHHRRRQRDDLRGSARRHAHRAQLWRHRCDGCRRSGARPHRAAHLSRRIRAR
jgi:succinate-semialdehyde dehydrogenase